MRMVKTCSLIPFMGRIRFLKNGLIRAQIMEVRMNKVLANDLRMGNHYSKPQAKCADAPALPQMLVVLDRDRISFSQIRELD